MTRVVVVGGSLAGAQAAQSVRRAGYEGGLVVVGAEPHAPYDRPPLSKGYLVDDEVDEARLRLRATENAEEQGIDLLLGRTATGLDPAGGRVALDGGEELPFEGLVIATGARPRRLPSAGGDGGPPAGVLELRTLDDARVLRAALRAPEQRVVVCGAGFIGAEVAASARELGQHVTLIDAAPAPLDRVLDRSAGMAIAELHRGHGVDVRLEVGVVGFESDGDSGPVRGVALDDGSTVDADVVVVGIGVIPNTEWLEGSGLTIDNGVVVDETCLAAPGIVAAGDVARWPNRRFGGRLMRVEQWDNAVEMGMYAGKRLVAHLAGDAASDGPFEPVPWFWSDQYDRKIQLAGIAAGTAEVVQGSLAEQRFVQLYLEDDRVVGALCWNRPRQAIMARQSIAAGDSADEIRAKLS